MAVFFGGVGFLLGISVLNFDFHWRDFTAVTLLVEVVMGVFVFAVFTLEIPMHWGRMHGKIGVVGSHSYPLDSFSHYEVRSWHILCSRPVSAIQGRVAPMNYIARKLHMYCS